MKYFKQNIFWLVIDINILSVESVLQLITTFLNTLPKAVGRCGSQKIVHVRVIEILHSAQTDSEEVQGY